MEEFIDWTNQQEGESFVYRGMPKACWGVESSASRRIRHPQKTLPPLPVLQSYIERLLQNARERRFQEYDGKDLTNLQLLAELQHYGAATCLIDFTSNALIALWFACRDEGRQIPGRVVAMADTPGRFSPEDPTDLPKDSVNFLSEDKLWKWKPIHPSIRIATQQSVFVFGPGKIDKKDYESIEIDGGSKGKIREELARRFDIVEQHLFRDFTGFVTSHAHDSPYPYIPADYFSLGLAAEHQEFYEEAEDFYSRALELDPQYTDAGKNRETVEKHLAQVKARQEDVKEVSTLAEALLEELITFDNKFGAALKGLTNKEFGAALKGLKSNKDFAAMFKGLKTSGNELEAALKGIQFNKDPAARTKELPPPEPRPPE